MLINAIGAGSRKRTTQDCHIHVVLKVESLLSTLAIPTYTK